jgi:cobalt-zinc-cadmium efflux system membrane fusion protein
MSSKARAFAPKLGLYVAVFAAGMAAFWAVSGHWGSFLGGASHGHDHEEHGEHAGHGHEEHAGHGHGEHAGHGHEEHGEQGKHNEHGERDAHAKQREPRVVSIDEETAKEFGVRTATAGPGKLLVSGGEALYGEIVPVTGKLAHVSARVEGTVRRVKVEVGEAVDRGEVLAVVESRRLAELQSSYLVSCRLLGLAEKELEREARLRDKGITSEKEHLEAQTRRDGARDAVRGNEAKLKALGFGGGYAASLRRGKLSPDGRYRIRAPFSGEVISLHAARGERLGPESRAFVVADLSRVWVEVTVYQSNLSQVKVGSRIEVAAPNREQKAEVAIDYVSPVMDSKTRTVKARGVLPNPKGVWRPGMFVRVRIRNEASRARVVVPRTSLATLHDEDVVFVPSKAGKGGYEVRQVRLGRRGATRVEVVSGLSPGERYVASNPFVLKAELQKSSFGGHHHH